MPIIFLVLVALLVAQIGFWDTLGVMLGAVGAIIAFLALTGLALGAAGYLLLRKLRTLEASAPGRLRRR